MPQYIEVNGEVIEFPDNMTDDQIATVLSGGQGAPDQSEAETKRLASKKEVKAPPKPSMSERVLSNFVPGLSNRPDITPEGQADKAKELVRQLGLTARAGLTGLSGIPAMAADPLAKIANQAIGREVFPSQYDVLANAMNLPKPANQTERLVQAGTEALAGVGGQARVAQQAGSAMLSPFTQDIAQQAAVAAPAAVAAQATSDRATDVGFSPLANFAATLAVGTLAGAAGGKAQRKLTADKTPPVTMDEVKQRASAAYSRVDNSGVSIKPQPILKTIDEIETSLINNENFNPAMDTHKPVKQVLDLMRSMTGTQRMSFTKLDQLRQSASALTRESNEAATRRLASKVVEGLDNKITSLQPKDLMSGRGALGETLTDIKEARDAWKRVSKATVIEDALNIAEARALDPRASEGELIRNQFKNLAANKNKMKLFNKDEQEAIRRVVSGEGAERILALAARFNPARNQLVSGLTIGASMTNPVAAATAGAVAGTGVAADVTLGRIQRKAAENVVSQILAGNIPQPRSTSSWRALVEAEVQALQNQAEQQQQQQQEPVVAP
jgi:hypothetical protein